MEWAIGISAIIVAHLLFTISARTSRLEEMVKLLVGTHPILADEDENLPLLPSKRYYSLGWEMGEANVLPGEWDFVQAREVRAEKLKLLREMARGATTEELKTKLAAHNAEVRRLDEEERSAEPESPLKSGGEPT